MFTVPARVTWRGWWERHPECGGLALPVVRICASWDGPNPREGSQALREMGKDLVELSRGRGRAGGRRGGRPGGPQDSLSLDHSGARVSDQLYLGGHHS